MQVDVYPAGRSRILALEHRWAIGNANARNVTQSDLSATIREDGEITQALQRIAYLTRISHVDRKALQPLDSLADVVATYGSRHDALHIGDVEPVARRAFPINVHIDVATASEPFREHGGDTGYTPHDGLDLPREP